MTPSPPDHDCGGIDVPRPFWPWSRDPRTLPGHCAACGLPRATTPTHLSTGEPVRRPDGLSRPASRVGNALLLLTFTVIGASVLMGGRALILDLIERERQAPAEHAKRQQRHDIQLRACLSSGGVPYFHESGGNFGLFARCEWP